MGVEVVAALLVDLTGVGCACQGNEVGEVHARSRR